MQKICVLGLGYIGLPTAAMLATHGFSVTGVDTNLNVVNIINNGSIHIEEPGLRTLVQAAIKSGNLKAESKPEKADIFIIAVPTPLKGRRADLSYVKSAAESIVPWLKEGNLIVLESTVPPRTTEELVAPISEQSGLKAGKDFYLAHCPERVLPGNILTELIAQDRVIGGITPESAVRAKELYQSFVEGKIYLTDATTAELVKIMENTYRDVNIALANELSRICMELGATYGVDVWEVIELANKHPRVNILRPGPGVGGHCLSVDPWFVVEKAPQTAKLIRLSREINDGQPEVVVDMIREMTQGIKEPKVTVLGVAYKGNVDDTRESPALFVIEGSYMGIYDPHIGEFDFELSRLEQAFQASGCAVVLADHSEFKCLSPTKVGKLMRNRQAIDTRNCLNLKEWQEAEFRLRSLGKGVGSEKLPLYSQNESG